MKYTIFMLLLAFAACKGTQSAATAGDAWKRKAEQTFGPDYRHALSPQGDKVLAWMLRTRQNLSPFELQWAVWSLDTTNELCSGKEQATAIEWHDNQTLALTKAHEMAQQGQPNTHRVLLPLANCPDRTKVFPK